MESTSSTGASRRRQIQEKNGVIDPWDTSACFLLERELQTCSSDISPAYSISIKDLDRKNAGQPWHPLVFWQLRRHIQSPASSRRYKTQYPPDSQPCFASMRRSSFTASCFPKHRRRRLASEKGKKTCPSLTQRWRLQAAEEDSAGRGDGDGPTSLVLSASQRLPRPWLLLCPSLEVPPSLNLDFVCLVGLATS